MIQFFEDTGINEILDLRTKKRLEALFDSKRLAAMKTRRVCVHNITVPTKENFTIEGLDKSFEQFSNKTLEISKCIFIDHAYNPEQRHVLISLIVEMYANAIYHSRSEIGAFGQCTTSKDGKTIMLTVYDYGIGIPESVRQYLYKKDGGEKTLTDQQALEWALEPANSTLQSEDCPRGAGLPSLKDFTIAQGGIIIIATGDTYYCNTGGKDVFTKLRSSMRGTMIILKLPDNGSKQ